MRGPTEPNEFDICYMRADPKIVVQRLEQDDPTINSLMVWHCKRFDVEVLRRFQSLRSLRIAYWYGESLDALTSMPHLEHLHIYMLPRVTDFSPLSQLSQLRALTFNAGIWSDLQQIKSYAPLEGLRELRLLDLIGFVPEDRRLDLAVASPKLTEIDFPDVHPLSELAVAMQRRPDLKELFAPIQSWGDDNCEKCGANIVRLMGLYGTRRRKYACVQCHAKRIEKHEAAFAEVYQSL